MRKLRNKTGILSFFKIVLPVAVLGFVILPNLVFFILHPPKPPIKLQPKYEVEVSYSEEFIAPANVEVTVEVPKDKAEKIGIMAVSFKVSESMPLKVVIAKLKFAPVPRPIEIYDVYAYIYIGFINLKTNDTVHPSGTIRFKLPKTWIIQHKYDPKRAVMLEYRNKWIRLETAMVGEDNFSYYYVAKTESFSIFAIAVERLVSENCTECHQNVAVELSMSPYHNFNCTFCHPGMSRNVTCVRCHPLIGNFSAHKKFIEWAENNTLMMGSNEACIACHTYAKIQIPNIIERRYLSFKYDMGELYER